MTERKQFRAIKGVRDILPPDSALWNWFEAAARRVMESYGYGEIRLPIFEQTELFARSIGADTDVVSKEMYTFPDYFDEETVEVARGYSEWKAGRNPNFTKEQILAAEQGMLNLVSSMKPGNLISLRPEATASVVRAYIEHGMHTRPGNVKLYYVGPMFRRERPQKGRYRQFYQIGAEVLGQTDHPAIDAELIEMLTVLLAECGLQNKWTLLVNSIGCQNCRPKYVAALREALDKVKSQMCADCQRRAEMNPLRVLDCKVEADQPIIAELPAITEHLDAPCREHFHEFQRQLKLRDISFMIAPRLVRGLDYYMRTTFEITSPALGAQNALVGGGRYDGLSELLGGPPTKGIGFALGTDRFIEAIKEAGKVKVSGAVDVFVAWIGAPAYAPAVKLARRLRSEGFSVELPPEEMKLKKSLGLADKLGACYALLIGENELKEGKYVLRRLVDGEQVQLGEDELVARLKQSG